MLKKRIALLLPILAIALQSCSDKKTDTLVGEYNFLFSVAPEDSTSVVGSDNNFNPGNKVTINSWVIDNFSHTNLTPNINLNYKNLTLKNTIKLQKPSKTPSALQNGILVTKEGNIYAIVANKTIVALKDNKVAWSTSLKENIVGVTYDLGFLYANDEQGGIYSIDTIDGSISWQKQLGSSIKSSPLIFESAIYVKDTTNSISSLSIYDGKVLWSKTGQKPQIELQKFNSAASNQFLVVFGLSTGELIALRRETGQEIWQTKINNRMKLNELSSIDDIKASPVIFNNHVFVSTYNKKSLYINANNGSVLWSVNKGSIKTPIITPNRVLMLDLSNNIVNIDNQTGNLLWNLELQSLLTDKEMEKQVNWYRPLLINSDIMVANSIGGIYFLSANNKALKHTMKIKNGIMYNPIVYKNQLIVMTKKGELLIYEAST